jgi:hypothetical protein
MPLELAAPPVSEAEALVRLSCTFSSFAKALRPLGL